MKTSTLFLFTMMSFLISCKEDVIRSSISSGDATFVCVEEDRILEVGGDENSTENAEETKSELSYGTCEEYKNQNTDSFDSFKTGLCANGVAYSDTNCVEEFGKTSLKKTFDCTLENSTRIYGMPESTSAGERNILVMFGEANCLMMNIAFDRENILQ